MNSSILCVSIELYFLTLEKLITNVLWGALPFSSPIASQGCSNWSTRGSGFITLLQVHRVQTDPFEQFLFELGSSVLCFSSF
jgi:hypothetical protein